MPRGDPFARVELDPMNPSPVTGRLTRRNALRVIAVGGFGALLAACAAPAPGAQTSAAPTSGSASTAGATAPQAGANVNTPPETLTIGVSSDALRMVPYGPSTSIPNFYMDTNMYEGLVFWARPRIRRLLRTPRTPIICNPLLPSIGRPLVLRSGVSICGKV